MNGSPNRLGWRLDFSQAHLWIASLTDCEVLQDPSADRRL